MGKSTYEQIVSSVEGHREELTSISRSIWELAEDPLEEAGSSGLLSDLLRKNGFAVTGGQAEMDTSFVAEWGSGGVHLAFLAEYDALSALGQQAVPYEAPIPGNNGHACGHNLLGTGSVGAAIAVKEYLEKNKLPGSVSVIGCPAEETMIGKIRLADAGIFDRYDAALSWHPDSVNMVSEYIYQAFYSVRFSYHGTPSHAALSPEAGRSALDAVELMNVAVNYLREHIPSGARIHYVITHGGEKPNIVPAFAQSWFFIRAPGNEIAEDIFERVKKIAQGAALMTETTVETEVLSWCPATRVDHGINRILQQALEEVGAPVWSPEEMRFAEEIQKTFDKTMIEKEFARHPRLRDNPLPLDAGISALTGKTTPFPASSDLSRVSTILPTGQIFTACYPIGTPGHSWPITACAGSSVGWNGMITAAKALALAGCRIISNIDIIEKRKGGKDG